MALPAFTFDTHKFVCKLKGAGFNDQQAEALTDAVQESQASLNVATKQDVVDVRRDMEQGFADVRREFGDLRKDMDAKFAGVDAKFAGVDAKLAAMEERSDAKHESLRKDMDAKHESLRKDMELMAARFEKRLLILGVTLGSITLFGQNALSTLLRLFQ